MGQIEKKDILIIFSYSGNTSELTNMLKYANRFRIKTIGIASKPESILLKASDIKLILPKIKEADLTGMVPTTSTSITLLLGDCLATTVMQIRNFSKEKFKVFHPGGNIGNSLLLAKDIMISGKKMPVINHKKNFKEALKTMNQKNLGILVLLKNKHIYGLVTDGDLRRFLNENTQLDKVKINDVMTKQYVSVDSKALATEAAKLMEQNKIFTLIVKDNSGPSVITMHALLEAGII